PEGLAARYPLRWRASPPASAVGNMAARAVHGREVCRSLGTAVKLGDAAEPGFARSKLVEDREHDGKSQPHHDRERQTRADEIAVPVPAGPQHEQIRLILERRG